METELGGGEAQSLVHRLCKATNAHDLEAVVDCFRPDYVNETPAHPARGFTGHEQVRRNWTQIFSSIPDITAEVWRTVSQGETVWSEWEMRGTRRDGALHLVRGVIIFGVAEGRAAWARFYLEPVEAGTENADEAVRRAVGAGLKAPT
jgi:ketosteroid isomerase-like protein